MKKHDQVINEANKMIKEYFPSLNIAYNPSAFRYPDGDSGVFELYSAYGVPLYRSKDIDEIITFVKAQSEKVCGYIESGGKAEVIEINGGKK